MYYRYVIDKINHRTSCYQGILVTLGTLQHKGELSEAELVETEKLFKNLDGILLTPPDIESENYRDVVSWFKSDTENEEILVEINRAINILKKREYKVILLKTSDLKDVTYSDDHQVLVKVGKYRIDSKIAQ